MAIERVAQNVNFGTAPQAAAVPTSVGVKSPDVNKFANNNTHQEQQPSVLTRLVSGLSGAVNTMATQELKTSREEAYLSGQAQAGTGVAREELESNIFTKDWTTAGYRDTLGRLAQADAEAQTAIDMKKLREQDPEAMQDYLTERRKKLIPSTEGMSLEARKGFLAQQLTSDRAAITKYTGERQKFIIDQTGKAVSTNFSTQLSAMDSTRDNGTAYLAQADTAFASLYNGVWANPNLPEETRIKLTAEGALNALNRNHQVLYEQMRREVITTKNPDGTETKATMLDRLPQDDQIKLAKAYEQSRADTSAFRNSQYNSQLGLLRAGLDDPTAPALSWDDFNAFLQQGEQLGVVSGDDRVSLTKAWADGSSKKLATGNLAAAYAAGDTGAMLKLGKGESEGVEAYVQMRGRRGDDPAAIVGDLLQIGTVKGMDSAIKKVGELTRSAVNSIGLSGTIDPGQLAMLNTVFKTLDDAKTPGNKSALSTYLQAFGEDQRGVIMTYREQIEAGQSPGNAAAVAAGKRERSSQLTDADRNAIANLNRKEDKDIIDSLTPRGLWGTIKNVIPDWARTKNGLNENAVSTRAIPWLDNETVANRAMAQTRAAAQEELNYISRAEPDANADSRREMMLAAVANRTIPTQNGPLVLPRLPKGVTAQDFFGVDKSVSPEIIGSALGEFRKPSAKGNMVSFSITARGEVMFQEYNAEGGLASPGGTFSPRDVAGAVRARQDKLSDEFHKTDGKGISVKGVSGTSVSFNGNNTVGADTGAMLEFRQSLVKHEDVRDTPYDDASGKVVNGKRVQTVGVGVSSHNPNYPKAGEDGKVAQKDIDSSFFKASNQAAGAGREVQRQVQLPGAAAFKLFSELAYQGGNSFAEVSATKPYIEAMKARDADKALAALKDTPQYKQSHSERRSYYEKLTQQAIAARS